MTSDTTGRPFVLPPYPYDRLAALVAVAEGHPGGMVDCSVGTPCDPPPSAVVEALGTSGTERGYPAAAGSLAFKEAAAGWLARRFEVAIGPSQVAPAVGTKELVASLPQHLHLKEPGRDTVLYPALSYPTYAMGGQLAGLRPVAVPERPDGSPLDLEAVAPDDVDRALLVWVNAPANPTGRSADLGAVAAWGRGCGVPVFSDECYAEFTWQGAPRSVLQHGLEGVVAVHSLSKRSNMAGLRVGFMAGDEELVGFLREVRRHAGLMVPGPVQAAATAALDDQDHVEHQRRRYEERLSLLRRVLQAVGCRVPFPEGGFYLWAEVPQGCADGWELAGRLAEELGLLVSPGDLYGPPGRRFVRVAAVQPAERLALLEQRVAARGDAPVAF